jgi:uncharacterized protein
MPINEAWCEFIRSHDIHVGVSVDGPKFVHDLHRKDRHGNGTFDRAMKGIELLRSHDIDFHVIAVVTAASLDHADEIFDFFRGLGIERLGLNVEELEGQHKASSLFKSTNIDRVRAFWTRLYERYEASDGRMRLREFDRAYASIAAPDQESPECPMAEAAQVTPLAIVSVDWRGDVSSFSPELLGMKSLQYGDFTFGNIRDLNLVELPANDKFSRIARDIRNGVKNCERACQYFALCGGGAPANKYFENGSFESTETMYCRTSIQIPIDIVLGDLERRLGLLA